MPGVSVGKRWSPALEMSLNSSNSKDMSGCIVERQCQTETQKAVEVTKAQESIGSLGDAILPEWVRIATGHKALGTHPISFRGSRGERREGIAG